MYQTVMKHKDIFRSFTKISNNTCLFLKYTIILGTSYNRKNKNIYILYICWTIFRTQSSYSNYIFLLISILYIILCWTPQTFTCLRSLWATRNESFYYLLFIINHPWLTLLTWICWVITNPIWECCKIPV